MPPSPQLDLPGFNLSGTQPGEHIKDVRARCYFLPVTRRLLDIAVCVGLVVISGCSGGTKSGTTPAVTEADLLAAPVPSLCKHDAGKLVDGKLPPDGHLGDVRIATHADGQDAGRPMMAFGDLTADGVDDGAFVTQCGAGGVPWPATIQAYTAGPSYLGGVDLSTLTHGREVVKSIGVADQTLRVIWMTNGPNDAQCCPTVEMQGVFKPEHGVLKEVSTTKLSG
jgi:hypothetical protein